MKIIYNLFLIVLFFSNCSTNFASITNEQKIITVDTIIKITENNSESNLNTDTLVVTKKSAVFFFQDSTEIEKRKRKTNEEDFYIAADDAMYYLSNARDFIDTAKLLSYEQNNKKFIKFVKLNKAQTLVKISNLKELCGIYFFDPKKEPKLIDFINVAEEYKQYFDK